MAFPLMKGTRSISSAPGARKKKWDPEEIRETLTSLMSQKNIDELLCPISNETDDDPDLSLFLSIVGSRLLLTNTLAILPPSRRFTRGLRPFYMFASLSWANGANGYGLAPSLYRRGLSVFGYSEGNFLLPDEFTDVGEWLMEILEPIFASSGNGSADWKIKAEEIWTAIKRDLPTSSPRPEWRAPVQDGLWQEIHEGVVRISAHFADGVRDGEYRKWAIVDEVDDWSEDLSVPIAVKQGPLLEEGQFKNGNAEGNFKFYDSTGFLIQKVSYVNGWPHGKATIFDRHLSAPATAEYFEGVPLSWEIPASIYEAHKVLRPNGELKSLFELAEGGPLMLVNYDKMPIYDISLDDEKELGFIPKLKIVGMSSGEARVGKFGRREIEIVKDLGDVFTMAYSPTDSLLPLTFFGAQAEFLGASRVRLTKLSSRFGL